MRRRPLGGGAPRPRRRRRHDRDDEQRWKAAVLRDFVERNGWSAVKVGTRVSGVALERWVVHRRAEFRRGELDPELREILEGIPGWTWNPITQRRLETVAMIEAYLRPDGAGSLTLSQLYNLGRWVALRRKEIAKGRAPARLVAELQAIPGWRWRRSQRRAF